MVNQPHLRPVEPPTDGESPTGRQQQRQRAGRALPTDRMKMDLQVRVLQTLGRLSGQRKAPVNADDLSRAVGDVAPSTVGLSNRFFKDAGWLDAAGRGRYAATDELVEYTRRLAAGTPARAKEPLTAAMRNSWFWEYLQPYLTAGPLAVNEAVIMLMRQADAIDSHVPMIRNVIEWMEFAGLVVTHDDQIVMADGETARSPGSPSPPSAPAGAGGEEPTETRAADEKATKPAGGSPPRAVVTLSFDVRLTAEDLAQLSPEQIKTFFEAVGTVAAVKNEG
jgi:hypothetical protein